MGGEQVRWVPASSADLHRRGRIVRPEHHVDVGIGSLLSGLGVLVLPILVIWGGAVPIGQRVLVGLGFGLVSALCCWVSLHGLYLSTEGVVVRGILRHRVRWGDIDRFELQAGSPDVGSSTMEWVTVVRTDGRAFRVTGLNRPVDWEGRHTPVKRAQDELRSYGALVEQLNAIHTDLPDEFR
jgi:hypothetical protein